MRRDFMSLLSLIKASAILHQASRERDESGRILATTADYANALDVMKQGLQQSNGRMVGDGPLTIVRYVMGEAERLCREVVCFALAEVHMADRHLEDIEYGQLQAQVVAVTTAALAAKFNKSKSTISRWVKQAVEAGYLVNEQKHRGAAYSMQLRLDEPLPDGAQEDRTFPTVTRLELWNLIGA